MSTRLQHLSLFFPPPHHSIHPLSTTTVAPFCPSSRRLSQHSSPRADLSSTGTFISYQKLLVTAQFKGELEVRCGLLKQESSPIACHTNTCISFDDVEVRGHILLPLENHRQSQQSVPYPNCLGNQGVPVIDFFSHKTTVTPILLFSSIPPPTMEAIMFISESVSVYTPNRLHIACTLVWKWTVLYDHNKKSLERS